MSYKTFDVVIIGNGITALTAALSFYRASLDVAIICSPLVGMKSKLNEGFERSYTIVESSRRLLHLLGVWKHIEDYRIGAYSRIEVWDSISKGYLKFDTPKGYDKPMGWVVPESLLINVLEFHTQEIPRFSKIESINDDHANNIELNLADGSKLTSTLLIWSDNSFPKLKSDMGLDFISTPYDQLGIVTNIRTEKSHNHVARQWFCRDGVLAFLPKCSEDISSIVFSVPSSKGNEILNYKTSQVSDLLTESSEAFLGKVEILDPPKSFSLSKGVADAWVKGNSVLIGSAAHEIHPLAGLGLNLNLMDVASLTECIGVPANDKNWPSDNKLRYYHRWRKSESLTLLMGTDAIANFFSNSFFNLGEVRGKLLKKLNKVLFFKESVVRRAMGLSGDLPAAIISKETNYK